MFPSFTYYILKQLTSKFVYLNILFFKLINFNKSHVKTFKNKCLLKLIASHLRYCNSVPLICTKDVYVKGICLIFDCLCLKNKFQ